LKFNFGSSTSRKHLIKTHMKNLMLLFILSCTVRSQLSRGRVLLNKFSSLLCMKGFKHFCCNISYDILQNSFRIVAHGNVKGELKLFRIFLKAFYGTIHYFFFLREKNVL